MQLGNVPEPVPQIQRLEPVLPAWRLRLLVAVKPYGSEGLEPVDSRQCPYTQEHGYDNSCVSGSGGSLCGGFYGSIDHAGQHYTRCGWLPRLMQPEQQYVVEPFDQWALDVPCQRAGRN